MGRWGVWCVTCGIHQNSIEIPQGYTVYTTPIMATFVNWMNRPQKKQSARPVTNNQVKIISGEEMHQFMNAFPTSIRISYGKKLHKKSDLSPKPSTHVLVPKGTKAYAWFTSYMGSPVCAMIDLDRQGTPSKIRIHPTIFETSLSYGTILYGTMVNSIAGKHKYLVCDNVFQYKGADMTHSSYSDKLSTIHTVMRDDISSTVYSHNFMSFATPCMFDSFDAAAHTMQHSSLMAYTPYCVQSWLNGDSRPYGIVHSQEFASFCGASNGPVSNGGSRVPTPTNTSSGNSFSQLSTPTTGPTRQVPSNNVSRPATTTNLMIRCESAQDTYSYYDERSRTRKNLCVPTFKNSVTMNTIFRNYKENTNLDAMEESDSDDDFEDISDDKYSHVGEERNISCVYDKALSGWVGVGVGG